MYAVEFEMVFDITIFLGCVAEGFVKPIPDIPGSCFG